MRFEGFHPPGPFIESVGYIMAESRLKDFSNTIYAANRFEKMMPGEA